jgi:Carboxypeptidase regulatory-like domain
VKNSTLCALLAIAGIGGLFWWHGHGMDLTIPGTANIAGRAWDARGRAVADAQVVLKDDAGRIVRRTSTGTDGRFSFLACTPGRYRVVGARADVGGSERVVTVKFGEEARANLPLNKANASLRLD